MTSRRAEAADEHELTVVDRRRGDRRAPFDRSRRVGERAAPDRLAEDRIDDDQRHLLPRTRRHDQPLALSRDDVIARP